MYRFANPTFFLRLADRLIPYVTAGDPFADATPAVMQALADEWSSANIRVNAVAPERANTPMRKAAFPNEDHAALLSAEEVAAATLRLAASGLTGQVLDVRR